MTNYANYRQGIGSFKVWMYKENEDGIPNDVRDTDAVIIKYFKSVSDMRRIISLYVA